MRRFAVSLALILLSILVVAQDDGQPDPFDTIRELRLEVAENIYSPTGKARVQVILDCVAE